MKNKLLLYIALALVTLISIISLLVRLNIFDNTKQPNLSNIEIINKQVNTKLELGYKLLDLSLNKDLINPYKEDKLTIENNPFNLEVIENNIYYNKNNTSIKIDIPNIKYIDIRNYNNTIILTYLDTEGNLYQIIPPLNIDIISYLNNITKEKINTTPYNEFKIYKVNLLNNKDNYITIGITNNKKYYSCPKYTYCIDTNNGEYFYNKDNTNIEIEIDKPNYYVLTSYIKTNSNKEIDDIKVKYYINTYTTKNGSNIYKLLVISSDNNLYEFTNNKEYKKVNGVNISKVLYKKENNQISIIIIYEDTTCKEYKTYFDENNL